MDVFFKISSSIAEEQKEEEVSKQHSSFSFSSKKNSLERSSGFNNKDCIIS